MRERKKNRERKKERKKERKRRGKEIWFIGKKIGLSYYFATTSYDFMTPKPTPRREKKAQRKGF